MKTLARRLALKYAQAVPATLRSPPMPEGMEVKLPKPPIVPVFEDPISKEKPISFDVEVPTPRFRSDLAPMSGLEEVSMRNDPEENDPATPTLRPEQLAGYSPLRDNLLAAVENMYNANVITGKSKVKFEQEIRRASHDAHLVDTYNEIKKIAEAAELHAMNYAKKMQKILLSLKS